MPDDTASTDDGEEPAQAPISEIARVLPRLDVGGASDRRGRIHSARHVVAVVEFVENNPVRPSPRCSCCSGSRRRGDPVTGAAPFALPDRRRSRRSGSLDWRGRFGAMSVVWRVSQGWWVVRAGFLALAVLRPAGAREHGARAPTCAGFYGPPPPRVGRRARNPDHVFRA